MGRACLLKHSPGNLSVIIRAILKSASAATAINYEITTSAHRRPCCDYRHYHALGPILYWQPRTTSLCNICFLHVQQILPTVALHIYMPSPLDHSTLASDASSHHRCFSGTVRVRGVVEGHCFVTPLWSTLWQLLCA